MFSSVVSNVLTERICVLLGARKCVDNEDYSCDLIVKSIGRRKAEAIYIIYIYIWTRQVLVCKRIEEMEIREKRETCPFEQISKPSYLACKK